MIVFTDKDRSAVKMAADVLDIVAKHEPDVWAQAALSHHSKVLNELATRPEFKPVTLEEGFKDLARDAGAADRANSSYESETEWFPDER